jgi:predicted ribosomally synthesized peptide with nif11-like leader
MAGIKELQQKLESDKAFAESLQKASDVKDMLQKIKDAGFDVKPEELVNTVENGKEGELDDEQLEAVAGGASKFWKDFWGGFKYGIVDPVGGIKDVYNALK